uniref:Uncharacterized protein n=1 Tax=Anguilla anguilla TaxID=7936 RepID=A0A0E9S349_ANGAN
MQRINYPTGFNKSISYLTDVSSRGQQIHKKCFVYVPTSY